MSRATTRSLLRRVATGVAVAATATVASVAAVSGASAATTSTTPQGYSVSINQGNVPATASGYSNHSCDEFGGKAATQDGWLFVASPDDFTKFLAVFQDQNGVERDVTWDSTNGAGGAGGTSVSFPKKYDHLAVTAPGAWTLENAYANLSGSAAFFTLSHTCPATQTPSSAPTVSFADNCTAPSIDVTLGNVSGTADALFTLSGGKSEQDTIAPGATQSVTVPGTKGSTISITVSASGLAGSPVTHTFDTSACNGPQTGANPAASISGDCTHGFDVTLDNSTGTADATFTVSDGSTSTDYLVPAGTTTHVSIAAPSTGSKTVTVTSGGQTLGAKTVGDCTPATQPATGATGGGSTGAQHAINPAVSFATACKTGITATFTNMKLDDTTMEPVTFTVTTPSGTTDSVTVAADQLVKRSYAVTEDTTGVVTVTAPGLTKQTKSYAKNCTTVLGEKVSKSTKTATGKKTTVQGEKATKLPFTGAPARQLAMDALALLGAGVLLTYAGRRRRPRGAHRR